MRVDDDCKDLLVGDKKSDNLIPFNRVSNDPKKLSLLPAHNDLDEKKTVKEFNIHFNY